MRKILLLLIMTDVYRMFIVFCRHSTRWCLAMCSRYIVSTWTQNGYTCLTYVGVQRCVQTFTKEFHFRHWGVSTGLAPWQDRRKVLTDLALNFLNMLSRVRLLTNSWPRKPQSAHDYSPTSVCIGVVPRVIERWLWIHFKRGNIPCLAAIVVLVLVAVYCLTCNNSPSMKGPLQFTRSFSSLAATKALPWQTA